MEKETIFGAIALIVYFLLVIITIICGAWWWTLGLAFVGYVAINELRG